LPAVFSQRAQKAANLRQPGRRNEQQAQTFSSPADNFDNIIGVLAHRYLEFVAKQGMEAWPLSRIAALKPAMLKWLQKQGVKAEALESAADRTIAMLQAALQSEHGRWLLQPRNSARVELPVGSHEEEEARTQRLDLTFIEDGVRWIIDYKSTRLAPDIGEDELQKQAQM